VTDSRTFEPTNHLDQPRHLGQLLALLRRQRGISQTAIALELGTASSANIHRFEKAGASLSHARIRQYIHLLAQPVIGGQVYRDALTPGQVEILYRMPHTLEAIQHASERVLHYDFGAIRAPHVPEPLRELKRRLFELRVPAYICDGLFFVHAVNGACLNLFSLNPATGYLDRWETWNSLAAKVMAASRVRRAHLNPDQYFPPNVDFFFRTSAEFSFTPQLLAFIERLGQLEESVRLRFPQWWSSAQTFRLHYDLHRLTRTIRYQNRQLHVSNPPPYTVHVETPRGELLPYYLVTWWAESRDQEETLENLPGYVAPDAVFFAADYDRRGNFHVNCWGDWGT
jgi:transcriptional regulator with XRE-family HTH domain